MFYVDHKTGQEIMEMRGGGTFFFNSSVSQRPKRAILEEMTILGYSSVDTDPEGNS